MREKTTAVTSSTILTNQFPVPAVVAVTAGLATALVACTPPAITNPADRATTGFISVITLALAANKMAPAAGRINV